MMKGTWIRGVTSLAPLMLSIQLRGEVSALRNVRVLISCNVYWHEMKYVAAGMHSRCGLIIAAFCKNEDHSLHSDWMIVQLMAL